MYTIRGFPARTLEEHRALPFLRIVGAIARNRSILMRGMDRPLGWRTLLSEKTKPFRASMLIAADHSQCLARDFSRRAKEIRR